MAKYLVSYENECIIDVVNDGGPFLSGDDVANAVANAHADTIRETYFVSKEDINVSAVHDRYKADYKIRAIVGGKYEVVDD